MAEEEESDAGQEASLPEWRRLERALLASLLGVRDAYRRRFTAAAREETEPPPPAREETEPPAPPREEMERPPQEERDARQPGSALDWLPLGVQLYTMSFLGARDLAALGSASRLWRCLASDPLLWRRLLLKDALAWRCVGRVGMPDVHALTRAHLAVAADFKAMYARGHAENPSRAGSRRAAPGVVARLPQLLRAALGARIEPRFAMFGPGLERLRVSLVRQLLSSPNEFRVAPSLQQHPHAGVGSGISFVFDEDRTFNILTLYSATKSERERGADAANVGAAPDKLLVLDGGASGVRGQGDGERPPSRASRRYRPTAHVQDACRHVDAFIYVANAEAGPGEPETAEGEKGEGGGSGGGGADETARVSAMLEAGPPGSPLLVLACTSEPSTVRVPSLLLAHRLRLQALPRAWLVCAADASSLGGVREGISWLLHSLSGGDWLSGD
uniref:F-box only protein 4 isoform X2 n=1 Tax=Petromyzon marinus TaxID=7757 RepID=A0AAJ7TQ93_PETMA|nr:F-box only protein 4 isoform X2 [Petromyzon marinus]